MTFPTESPLWAVDDIVEPTGETNKRSLKQVEIDEGVRKGQPLNRQALNQILNLHGRYCAEAKSALLGGTSATEHTTSFTLTKDNLHLVSSTSDLDITLPIIDLELGWTSYVLDVGERFGINDEVSLIYVATNIDGVSEDFELDEPKRFYRIIYTTAGWEVF